MRVEIKFEFEQAEGQVQTLLDKVNALVENTKSLMSSEPKAVEPKPTSRKKIAPTKAVQPEADTEAEAETEVATAANEEQPSSPVIPGMESDVTPAPTTAKGVTLPELRVLLASRVADHKAEIKAKLTELGAGNLTTLDPAKYGEMYNYLNSLS